MTREEAVEEILRGAYTACIHCRGTGTGPAASLFIGGGTDCKSCNGSGKWRRGDYVTACFILDMEIPPIPSNQSLEVWCNTFWPRALSSVEIQVEYASTFGKEYAADWSGFKLDDT